MSTTPLRPKRPRYVTTSPGERLWFALRDWWQDTTPDFAFAAHSDSLDWTDQRKRVGLAATSVAVSGACVRLIDRAHRSLKTCATAADGDHRQHQESVAHDVRQYCVNNLGFSYVDPILRTLGVLSFDSAWMSGRKISKRTRNNIERSLPLVTGKPLHCYICGIAWGQPHSLDHLWPQAFGGVSDEENLLPVCESCNNLKMDRITWDVYGVVTDYAWLRHGPSKGRIVDMALHRRAAGRYAEQNQLSLQEAFLAIGPVSGRQTIDLDEPDWFFNLTAHDTTVMPELWD